MNRAAPSTIMCAPTDGVQADPGTARRPFPNDRSRAAPAPSARPHALKLPPPWHHATCQELTSRPHHYPRRQGPPQVVAHGSGSPCASCPFSGRRGRGPSRRYSACLARPLPQAPFRPFSFPVRWPSSTDVLGLTQAGLASQGALRALGCLLARGFAVPLAWVLHHWRFFSRSRPAYVAASQAVQLALAPLVTNGSANLHAGGDPCAPSWCSSPSRSPCFWAAGPGHGRHRCCPPRRRVQARLLVHMGTL